MTTVTLLKNSAGRVTGFEADGHAKFGEMGTDIVCAGISAILQTAVIGITQVLKLPAGYFAQDGQMTLTLERGAECEKSDLVFQIMIESLKSLQASYHNNLSLIG